MFWEQKVKWQSGPSCSSLSRLSLKRIVLKRSKRPVLHKESIMLFNWCPPRSLGCENMGCPHPFLTETHSRQTAPAVCCSGISAALFEVGKGNSCYSLFFCFVFPLRLTGKVAQAVRTALASMLLPEGALGRPSSPPHRD